MIKRPLNSLHNNSRTWDLLIHYITPSCSRVPLIEAIRIQARTSLYSSNLPVFLPSISRKCTKKLHKRNVSKQAALNSDMGIQPQKNRAKGRYKKWHQIYTFRMGMLNIHQLQFNRDQLFVNSSHNNAGFLSCLKNTCWFSCAGRQYAYQYFPAFITAKLRKPTDNGLKIVSLKLGWIWCHLATKWKKRKRIDTILEIAKIKQFWKLWR